MERVIIDTDIGSDVDDAMALSLAMRSPEIVIEGVTTVYGYVDVKTQMASKLLKLGNRTDVKVYKGLAETILRNRDVWWAKGEGEGVLTEDDVYPVEQQHAVDFIIETIMRNPGEITLIGIGPLTNIAAAIIREPKIIENVKKIVIMGGVVRLGENALSLPYIEHNIKCDPEAASVVFGSGASITMVGLDVTSKVLIKEEDKNRLKDSGDPLNEMLAKMAEKWFRITDSNYSPMHDPLTVSLLIDPTLVKSVKAKIKILYDHNEYTGQTIALLDESGNVDLCIEVDHERFMKLLLNRLLQK